MNISLFTGLLFLQCLKYLFEPTVVVAWVVFRGKTFGKTTRQFIEASF